MKDGVMDMLTDKLQALIDEFEEAGVICMIVGADRDAMDHICCDVHRLQALQTITNRASFDLLKKYNRHVEKQNDRNH